MYSAFVMARLEGMTRWISPQILGGKSWDPLMHLGPAAALGEVRGPKKLLVELLADIQEGDRRLEGEQQSEAGTPAYRPGHVGTLRWNLTPENWQQPTQTSQSCVRPGDVVLTRWAPIRAAWVTGRLHRHPIDANCYLLRGMSPETAFWVSFCLNQPLYGEYLLRSAGASVLPRVTMRALRELPVMIPPAEVRVLASRAAELLDGILAEEDGLRLLMSAVEERISPADALQDWRTRVAALEAVSWSRRIDSVILGDSLMPSHAIFGVLTHELKEELGWQHLGDVLAPESEQPSRGRLTPDSALTLARVPYLRISDVGSDFTLAAAPQPQRVTWPGRIYHRSLRRDEVLVSLFAASPKVVFAGAIPAEDVLVTDHWERLRFRETPGAWAMIMNSQLVRLQIGMLARGAARQFLGAGSIQRIVLPNIEREERELWDHQLRRYQQNRLRLEAAWQKLAAEAQELFDRLHREAGTTARARSPRSLEGGASR